MKLLLDENLPRKLKLDFSEHEVFTVVEKGWNGVSNGELLKLMISEKFEVFMTFDKNFQHQQNLREFTLTVFVLSAPSNTYMELAKHSSKVLKFLRKKICQLESSTFPKLPSVRLTLSPCYRTLT